ncbi:hypothetical protein BV898_01059 [Hypsibius exemplaris]|uniref:Uncharacterized protein n=1 Tax=Hypsibius exemplaris TaxID=2072580 RepID=A0A1W0XDH6_HYPEX|nr:hypothetical protein BV898_01059 [Hypsibius exemplaris]
MFQLQDPDAQLSITTHTSKVESVESRPKLENLLLWQSDQFRRHCQLHHLQIQQESEPFDNQKVVGECSRCRAIRTLPLYCPFLPTFIAAWTTAESIGIALSTAKLALALAIQCRTPTFGSVVIAPTPQQPSRRLCSPALTIRIPTVSSSTEVEPPTMERPVRRRTVELVGSNNTETQGLRGWRAVSYSADFYSQSQQNLMSVNVTGGIPAQVPPETLINPMLTFPKSQDAVVCLTHCSEYPGCRCTSFNTENGCCEGCKDGIDAFFSEDALYFLLAVSPKKMTAIANVDYFHRATITNQVGWMCWYEDGDMGFSGGERVRA